MSDCPDCSKYKEIARELSKELERARTKNQELLAVLEADICARCCIFATARLKEKNGA